jgi:hypothetical protein
LTLKHWLGEAPERDTSKESPFQFIQNVFIHDLSLRSIWYLQVWFYTFLQSKPYMSSGERAFVSSYSELWDVREVRFPQLFRIDMVVDVDRL